MHRSKTFRLVANAGNDELTRELCSPYILRMSFSNWQWNYPLGEYAADKLGKRAALVASNFVAGKQMGAAFRSGFEAKFKTERELESCFREHIAATRGMVLVWTSGQNIDRLVTVYKACKKSGRQLILDMYTAEILQATGNPNVPQADWNGVRVFLPDSQRRQIIKSQKFELAERYKPRRIYPEKLALEAPRSVMLFRPSMSRDLETKQY